MMSQIPLTTASTDCGVASRLLFPRFTPPLNMSRFSPSVLFLQLPAERSPQQRRRQNIDCSQPALNQKPKLTSLNHLTRDPCVDLLLCPLRGHWDEFSLNLLSRDLLHGTARSPGA